MSNLEIYEKVRKVPDEAKKEIKAGRLKGMTDINPMWRIKVLTEQFGACGIGWYSEIVNQWLENGANGEITANVEIKLYIKYNGEWSKGIQGVGGSKFVTKETNGYYTDDECYKKAYTDAISVACKSLGIGADVYWDKDKTKYDGNESGEENPQNPPKAQTTSKSTKKPQTGDPAPKFYCKNCNAEITTAEKNYSEGKYKKALCRKCQKEADKPKLKPPLQPMDDDSDIPF